MEIVKPSVKLIWITPDPLKKIELAGRTCYKSENKITDGSSERFVQMLIKRDHTAMVEHASVSYRVICDRGVTHEIVRHRLFSYAQESTRYVNYQKRGIEFIKPCFWSDQDENLGLWKYAMKQAEVSYNAMVLDGATPQEARSVLPNSLKTEIVITGNLREWLLFFTLRTTKFAHPQMQEVANMLLEDIKTHIPIVFDNIK